MKYATYGLLDGSLLLTGTPEEITNALWHNCKCHEPLESIQDYMAWQRENERKWNRKVLDINTYESFIDSLVEVGILIPMT